MLGEFTKDTENKNGGNDVLLDGGLTSFSLVSKVKKRDGRVVEFDLERIVSAAYKAMSSTGEGDRSLAVEIAARVNTELLSLVSQDTDLVPEVEGIQDLVEKHLVLAGLPKTAKSFILYRYEHSLLREEEKRQNVVAGKLKVKNENGVLEVFDPERLKTSLDRLCEGVLDRSSVVSRIVNETEAVIYEGISKEELSHALINVALQNVQEDTSYDKVATRLLLKNLYKSILGDYGVDIPLLTKKYKANFLKYIKDLIKGKVFDPRMSARFDLKKLSEKLDIAKDDLFNYAGLSTLLDRYAIKGKDQKSLETPQYLFMRVAMGLSFNEKNPTEVAMSFYGAMSDLLYIAGGSTNIGAGTVNPALSNCFLLEIHDDIDHISKSISDIIKISKATGGIGTSITKLRATGSPLSSNNTVSSGPTPFAKIIDTAIRAIQRGGKKKGALCFYMENWHIDFPEYLNWKHNAGDDYLRMRTANTAVFLSDEFMRRVKTGEDWYMFDPKETADLNELYGKAFSARYKEYIKMAEKGGLRVFKKVPAEEQFRQILVMLQSTSHPWLTWKDVINTRALNNNTGTIHMSNLCTEICLPQDKDNIAVCNLASINLVRHLSGGKMDWQKLEETTRLAVHHLDNLIDINVLPIAEAAKSDQENRAIGLGVMGLAELFEVLKVSYDSTSAYEITDKIFEFISFMAIDESANLAAKRGSYKHFKGSGWSKGLVPFDTLKSLETSRGKKVSVSKDSSAKELGLDWKEVRRKVKKGMRNATLMAVAPNANIGLVAGVTPGIDPRFAQVFSRNKISGKYLDINHNLVTELKDLGIWEDVRIPLIESQGDISDISEIPQEIRDRYKTAFTISPLAFVEVAARAQKWVDQSLSRNMYLDTRVIDDLMAIYQTAWEKGLKSTYYLHMKPRHTAEQSTTIVNKAVKIGKSGFGVLRNLNLVEKKEPLVVKTDEKALACPVDPQERLQCDSCQ